MQLIAFPHGCRRLAATGSRQLGLSYGGIHSGLGVALPSSHALH
jgi:hypothetical protein